VADSAENGDRVTAFSDWQGWKRWVEDVDWSDWRSWLQRFAATGWAPAHRAFAPWVEAPRVGPVSLTLRAYEEDEPGDRIREHLAAT
jgi:hypothetical protein